MALRRRHSGQQSQQGRPLYTLQRTRQFRFGVALEEFMLLQLYPISLAWAWPLRKTTYLQNRALLPAFSGDRPGLGTVLWSICFPMVFWAALVGFLVSPPTSVNLLEVLFTSALMGLRHSVIAIKYGYLTKEELAYLQSSLAWSFQNEIMMVTSWLDPPVEVIGRELQSLTPKIGRSFEDVAVSVVSYPQKGNIHGLARHGTATRYTINAKTLLLELVKISPIRKPKFRRIAHLTATLHALIYIIYAFTTTIASANMNQQWWSWLLTLTLCAINYWNVYVNTMFLSIAYCHYRRLQESLSTLGEILIPAYCAGRYVTERALERSGHGIPDSADGELYTHLDCSDGGTVRAFLIMRTALRNMGSMYRKRIDLFTAVFLFYIVVIVGILVGQVLFNYAPDSDLTVIVIAPVFNAVTFTIGVVSMAYRGGQINRMTKLHMQYLIRHRLEGYLEEHEVHETASDEDLSRLWMADRVIKTCLTTLANSKPIRFFGFRAGDSFITGLISVVVSGMLAGIRELSR